MLKNVQKLFDRIFGFLPEDYAPYEGEYSEQLFKTAEMKKENGELKRTIFWIRECLELSQDKKTPPLVDPSLSRFVFIINDGTRAWNANLPESEALAVCAKSRDFFTALAVRSVIGSIQSEAESDEPPQVTLNMPSEWKGKTPDEVLMMDSANREKLLNTRNMIENNLNDPRYSKYAAHNRNVIAAIDSSIRRLDTGILSDTFCLTTSSLFVYEGTWKPTGDIIRNETIEGRSFLIRKVYRLDIRRELSGPSPWFITIGEGECPVTEKENGQPVVAVKYMKNKSEKTFHTNDTTWQCIIEKLYITISAFEANVYAYRKSRSKKYTYFGKLEEREKNGKAFSDERKEYPKQNTECQRTLRARFASSLVKNNNSVGTARIIPLDQKNDSHEYPPCTIRIPLSRLDERLNTLIESKEPFSFRCTVSETTVPDGRKSRIITLIHILED